MVTGYLAVVGLVKDGGRVVGRITGMIEVDPFPISTSAQERNSSWFPHPTAPWPSGQIPQLFPAI